jgi:hypothetical protein
MDCVGRTRLISRVLRDELSTTSERFGRSFWVKKTAQEEYILEARKQIVFRQW